MNDMSSLYADIGGPGSVAAAKMAVEGYLKSSKSKLKVEVVSAEVKKPFESKYPYDYYKVRATIPAEQAFRPEKEGGCPLVK